MYQVWIESDGKIQEGLFKDLGSLDMTQTPHQIGPRSIIDTSW
jgi:hypothetical protein